MFNKNEKKISIEGMSCKHCAKKVEDTLNSIDNIKKVKVNLENKEAIITYKDPIDDEIINTKIEELGYKIINIEEV